MAVLENNNTKINTHELLIEVDAATFEAEVSKAFKKNAKSISVPGFRKGKAPRKMVEKMYGEGVFFEDAINALYPVELHKAVEELKLDLVARPEVEILEVSKEAGFKFKAICTVKPEVEVSNYKGIEIEKEVNTVTEEQVDERINAMRERNSRLVDVTDRAAELKDTVVFDFTGYVDGTPFAGGDAKDFSLELGSGQFIPGFEEQMVGKNIEENFDVEVTFPEEYHAEELKGKLAKFECIIHSIKTKEMPELDDEFAKDVSEFDTLADLVADTKAKMQEQADKTAETNTENKLIDKVIENMTGEIPEQMYDARVDEFVQDFEQRLQSQGLKLEEYLKYTGMEMASFRKTFEEQAQKQVKIRLALEKIVEVEKITASDEDIDAEYAKLAENYKMEVEKIMMYIPKEQLSTDIAVNKAIDLVKETAKIK